MGMWLLDFIVGTVKTGPFSEIIDAVVIRSKTSNAPENRELMQLASSLIRITTQE